jgi:hypothetical protein
MLHMTRKPTKERPSQKPALGVELEVAFGGEGVRPKDIPLRALLELLEATIGVMEAVAREAGLPSPKVSLAEVRDGSAAYAIVPSDEPARACALGSYEAAKLRGKDSGLPVRKALARLNRAGTIGTFSLPVRLRPKGLWLAGPTRKEILVAPPVEAVPTTIPVQTVLEGTIVGVLSKRDGVSIRLRTDSGTEEFDAHDSLGGAAGRLFGTRVRASVVHSVSEGGSVAETLESLERWDEGDFMDAMSRIRGELDKRGIDSADWIEELD